MTYSIRNFIAAVGGGTGITFYDATNFTAVAGDTLLAVVYWQYGNNTTPISNVSDAVGSNDGWVQIGSQFNIGTTQHWSVYALQDAAAGSCTVRVNWPFTVSFPRIGIVSIEGLSNTLPITQIAYGNQGSPTTATNAVTTSTVVPASQPAMIFGYAHNPTTASRVPNAGSDFTDIGSDVRGRYEHKRVTTLDAVAATFTATFNEQHVSIVIVAPESTGLATITGTSNVTTAAVTGSATGLLTQVAVPTSDGTVNAWVSTGANLFSVIDEYPADDGDYIYTNTLGSAARVKLANMTDPLSSVNHVMQYRLAGNGAATVTVKLYSGGTGAIGSGDLIRTWTHAAVSSTVAPYEQTLSGGEADSISDYANLYLEFEAT